MLDHNSTEPLLLILGEEVPVEHCVGNSSEARRGELLHRCIHDPGLVTAEWPGDDSKRMSCLRVGIEDIRFIEYTRRS